MKDFLILWAKTTLDFAMVALGVTLFCVLLLCVAYVIHANRVLFFPIAIVALIVFSFIDAAIASKEMNDNE